MKTPTLILTVTVFALTATVALAGGPGDAVQPGKDEVVEQEEGEVVDQATEDRENSGFRGKMQRFGDRARRAGHRLTHTDHTEEGEDHHVRDGIRNFGHGVKLHRPRVFWYLEMRKLADGKVKIFACEPMVERLVRDQQCRQIHAGALDAKGLYACAARRSESKFGRRIGRNLDKLMRRDFDLRRIDDSMPDVAGYTQFLKGCQGGAGAPPKSEPAPDKANPEFKPVDPPADQAEPPVEGGTL